MSDEALAEFMSGWKEHTPNYILCEMEFKRRQIAASEFRGWASLIFAAVALIVSAIALWQRNAP
jgi:hypothetical protein